MHNLTRFATIGAALLAAGLAADDAFAQKKAKEYPTKPIRLIVPFAPGGGTDIVARLLAQKLTEAFKQTVIVDNRAGGGGTIGAETAVRATPDGYTVIIMSGSYATNAAMFKLPYDPVNDILPMGLIGDTAFLVALHPGVPIKSINELLAFAKSKPGALNYGSSGTGGIAHLSGELFDMMAATKMTHVPYKGTGPALTDLLGGQIQLIFGSAPSTIPLVRGNRLRAIAVTTSQRSAALPDLPTVAEAGVPGYEVVLWYGVLGPKGLPNDIVARWNAEIRKATKLPDMKQRLASEGFDIADSPPEVFQAVVKRDVAKWTKVVKEAKVKAIQ
ncbi:MAG: tripartite tricarboxylate transporter substrate binding protein [Betaproteobacteria bacterium]|nr:tripartite tricarboxylate transporter substrate binding protein [Betaproteobacteria bacterium]